MNRAKLADIAEVASGQWGMISTAQATVVGADARTLNRLANGGELERLAHGIYRLVGSPPGPFDDLRAAWLALDPRRTAAERIAAGPTEIVSHRSAAMLQELGDVDADMLEFTTSVRRQPRRADVRIHRGVISDDRWTLADGLPVTTPLRTIEDLAAAHADRGHLAGVVRDALLQHGVPIKQVAVVLGPHARAYGVTDGSGDELIDLMLQQVGIPQSLLDVAARAGQDVERILTVNAIQHNVHVEKLIQAAIGKAFAGLAPDAPNAGVRGATGWRSQSDLSPGAQNVERQKFGSASEGMTPETPKDTDDER